MYPINALVNNVESLEKSVKNWLPTLVVAPSFGIKEAKTILTSKVKMILLIKLKESKNVFLLPSFPLLSLIVLSISRLSSVR